MDKIFIGFTITPMQAIRLAFAGGVFFFLIIAGVVLAIGHDVAGWWL
jgi:hypothetical protein